MYRRRYLAALGTGATALAGCLGRDSAGDAPPATEDDGEATTDAANDGTAGSGPTGDPDLPVPQADLDRGAAKDAIPAITDPAFGPDWAGVDADLNDDDRVIGVERDGAARAYPLRILNWHEVVNDDFGGPLLVTYCPLCGSGVTGVRTVAGEPTTFGVSGLLWKSDLVMYDDLTDSLWSQIRAQAIRGPQTGERIDLVPSALTTLSAWREEYPDTEVLLPPPASGTIGGGAATRDYDRDPYAGYANDSRIGIGRNDFDDDRLAAKTIVIGVEHDGVARAYPRPRVAAAGVVNDEVNGLPVAVATDSGDSLAAYERTVDGRTLTFERVDERHLRADGSRWRIVSGEAADGPHEGTTLTRANDVSPKFWFAWAEFHPDTEVYGG